MEKFRNLGIPEEILKAIKEAKFEKPSEIQEKSIPLISKGLDIIGESATGSGKTLAFGVGIINKIERGKGIQALILTPTRELALQVSSSLEFFSKYKPFEIVTIYGGVGIDNQIKKLKTAEVVVGTPGRILDHLQRRTIDFMNLKILVLDEADRMVDMGFVRDVEKIIGQCPIKRQTLLFSATISSETDYIAKKFMKKPVEVRAESRVDATKLTQIYYDVDNKIKFSALVTLLKNDRTGLVMVFCNTKANTDFVAKNLKFAGIDAHAIHGGFSQEKRERALKSFHSKYAHVLVCTDVAARGLDIKKVSHVYNYDLPKEPNQYIHRVGRTARAGEEGKAISLVSSRDYDNFANILNKLGINIIKTELPKIDRIRIRWMAEKKEFRRGGSGGRFGERQNGGSSGGRFGERQNGRSSGGSSGGSYRRMGSNNKSSDRRGSGNRRR
ncbi:MAG: DEAD/DEAH box helicase [Candidatus Pacearchaeota archaeon]|nr:DEAD/DEAH box helicase [Candidatus Pacearchaeota archaeon]